MSSINAKWVLSWQRGGWGACAIKDVSFIQYCDFLEQIQKFLGYFQFMSVVQIWEKRLPNISKVKLLIMQNGKWKISDKFQLNYGVLKIPKDYVFFISYAYKICNLYTQVIAVCNKISC